MPQLRRALATLEPAWELRVDALRKVAAEAQNLSRVATKYSPGVVDEVNCTRMLTCSSRLVEQPLPRSQVALKTKTLR